MLAPVWKHRLLSGIPVQVGQDFSVRAIQSLSTGGVFEFKNRYVFEILYDDGRRRSCVVSDDELTEMSRKKATG